MTLVAAVTALVVMGVGTASGVTVRAGNLIVVIDGTVKPNALPAKKMVPIKLKVHGEFKTADGAHVPVLQTLDLDFDKNGQINAKAKGLGICKKRQIENTTSPDALKACKKALVGRGTSSAEVQFPDQAPFDAKGPLLLFNAPPKKGLPQMLYHIKVDVPAPTTFVIQGQISKAKGKYGTHVFVKIPPIAGGYGSATGFDATVNEPGYLKAKCPTGKFFAAGEFKFRDGTKLSGNVVKSCTPKR